MFCAALHLQKLHHSKNRLTEQSSGQAVFQFIFHETAIISPFLAAYHAHLQTGTAALH